MLQRQRGHADEPIGMGGDRRGNLLVLQLNQVASERAVRRVSPGVDVDGLIVDALFVHVLQTRRRAGAEGNGPCQVDLGDRGKRRVLHEVPHFRHECVGVDVDDRHAPAADHHPTSRRAAPATRRAPRSRTHALRSRCQPWRSPRSQKLPAIRHGVSLRLGPSVPGGDYRCDEGVVNSGGTWRRPRRRRSSPPPTAVRPCETAAASHQQHHARQADRRQHDEQCRGGTVVSAVDQLERHGNLRPSGNHEKRTGECRQHHAGQVVAKRGGQGLKQRRGNDTPYPERRHENERQCGRSRSATG